MRNRFANLVSGFGGLGLLLSSAHASQTSPRILISDIDDTIKLTHVLDKPDAVYRGLFSKRAFSGMSTLYRKMGEAASNPYKPELATYYVSGSPELIRGIVENFLSFNSFPASAELQLRQSLNVPAYDYKMAVIGRLMKNLDASVLLIGDDGEKDPEVYRDIEAHYHDRVDAIYIHRIQNRPLYPDEVGFDTAMDIALNEVAASRLSAEAALEVADAIEADDLDNLILDDSYCPDSSAPRESTRLANRIQSRRLLERANDIERLIRSRCAALQEAL